MFYFLSKVFIPEFCSGSCTTTTSCSKTPSTYGAMSFHKYPVSFIACHIACNFYTRFFYKKKNDWMNLTGAVDVNQKCSALRISSHSYWLKLFPHILLFSYPTQGRIQFAKHQRDEDDECSEIVIYKLNSIYFLKKDKVYWDPKFFSPLIKPFVCTLFIRHHRLWVGRVRTAFSTVQHHLKSRKTLRDSFWATKW